MRTWNRLLGLDQWSFTHTLYAGKLPKEFGAGPNETTRAITRPQYEYLRARVHWNKAAIDAIDDEELEEIYVHEMMHVLVHEMRDFQRDNGKACDIKREERVVSQLTGAFLRVAKRGRSRACRR